MRGLIFLLPIILIGVLGWYLLSRKDASAPQIIPGQTTESTSEQQKQADFTASFEIITNGTKRTFAQAMYHNQSEDVFIEGSNPNAVRVKKEGVTWDDFFKTLPMELTKECLTTGTGQTFCTNINQTLRFVLNGIEKPDALNLEIKPNGSLQIIYGN